MSALVAKTYEGLPQVSDVYTVNGKQYVKVQLKNGNTKTVRAYTEKEYAKFYPEVKIIKPAKSQREVLGFGEAGFIWVFKGDTYSALDWFRYQPTRYARMWGWYLPSDMEMPEPLPAGITPVKLPWEAVCMEDGLHLKDEKEVTKIASGYIYETGKSEWIGKVGQRVKDIPVICTRISHVMGYYGDTTIYNFVDENDNHLMWSTTSNQDVEEDGAYLLAGTIKALDTYRGNKQTILNRCKINKVNFE